MSAREHLVDVEKVNDVESFAIQWTTQFLYLVRGMAERLVLGQISEEERLRRLLIMTDILLWKSENDASNEEGPGADGWRTSVKLATRKLLKQALEKLAWIKQFLGELMFSMEYPANTSEVIEICKLVPDEEYLFAVAFTKKHRPSSEKSCLGPSTAPILASPALCEKIALGHIAQFLDIRLCHRLLIALELNMQHKSFSNAMAVIETIALLLGPYLQLQFEIQDITEVRCCLLAILFAKQPFYVSRRQSFFITYTHAAVLDSENLLDALGGYFREFCKHCPKGKNHYAVALNGVHKTTGTRLQSLSSATWKPALGIGGP
ncbi:unnamed protein product [Dibothriocephalus latus]|uniref:Uncharacterized protein n=1 Tax=Dibothriocephalus latus TaxID=60516 RepID=A0A3P6TLU5_DIBLA|nr:unnamed protein product [Dibothriocephalus latus]